MKTGSSDSCPIFIAEVVEEQHSHSPADYSRDRRMVHISFETDHTLGCREKTPGQIERSCAHNGPATTTQDRHNC